MIWLTGVWDRLLYVEYMVSAMSLRNASQIKTTKCEEWGVRILDPGAHGSYCVLSS